MATPSFLSDWLKRALSDDANFRWPIESTAIEVLLIAGGIDYEPLPTPGSVADLAEFEYAGANYARQPITSRTIGGEGTIGTGDFVALWQADAVVFPNLGTAGDTIEGAWVTYEVDGDDVQSLLVAWLNLCDEDGDPLELTGGSLTLAIPATGLVRVQAGA